MTRWGSLIGWESLRHVCSAASVGIALLDRPIKDVVVLEAFTDEEVAEELAQVRVIGSVIEAESAAVVEVDAEPLKGKEKSCELRMNVKLREKKKKKGSLVREAAAEELGGRGHLSLHDAVVLLLLCGSFETLPGEGTSKEVHENVAEGLHVVTTRLLCGSAKKSVSCVVHGSGEGAGKETDRRPSGC